MPGLGTHMKETHNLVRATEVVRRQLKVQQQQQQAQVNAIAKAKSKSAAKPKSKPQPQPQPQQQDPKARDEGLLRLAAQAYKVQRLPSESLQRFAKRVLRTRDPNHHVVKKDQWLLALANRLYADLAIRCKSLARNQQRQRDRTWFAESAKAFEGHASTIAGMAISPSSCKSKIGCNNKTIV